MNAFRCRTAALAALVVLAWPWSSRYVRGAEPLTFERDVRPILKAMCFRCHGEQAEPAGGLDLRLVRLMVGGGESGPAIAPHHAAESLLCEKLSADEMPPGQKKLTAVQKETITRWIDEGALTARPEPANVAEARFSLEERDHWAFQPVVRPTVPQPRGYELLTPVDAFIAARLTEEQLPFSPTADRTSWIRRVTLDLTGLPPTPDEVAAFEQDGAPDAYERLVDRLLASPSFGVRWGRHWLDVVGYAESNGGPDADVERPYAWRYRDYVIDAVNRSKPFDQFVLEQLAGDELITGDIDANDPRQLELLTATGFVRLAPDATQAINTLEARNSAAADAVKIVSTSLLGLTVGCAQCHEHKFDPIGMDDYYRFRAILDPAFPLQAWTVPNDRLVDMTTRDVRSVVDEIETRARALDDDLSHRREAVCQQIQDRKLADVPAAERDAVNAAVRTPDGQRTPEQVKLLDRYPMVKPLNTILGLLVEYDATSYRAFEKELASIAAVRATKPDLRLVMATREQPGVVPTSAVFFRGDPESPGAVVQPGELAILAQAAPVDLPVKDESLPSTGRRLAYARHLISGRHPLTARVFVNRVWQYHFGRGIVATPADFGLSGERPSHPQLLDWLADDLVTHGWDPKRLHRLIVLSRTYRQSAARTNELDQRDPENRLFARMSIQRLEAEAIRDSLLSVAGLLDPRLGGKSLPVTVDTEGKAVIGTEKFRDGLRTGVEPVSERASRRSVYVQVRRSLPLNMLATFDQPVMNPNCPLRASSTVATQALWFLNDTMCVECADELSRDVCRCWIDPTERLARVYRRLFAAEPDEEQRRVCLEFVAQQAATLAADADPDWQKVMAADASAVERRAWSTLCQVLLASNQFVYRP